MLIYVKSLNGVKNELEINDQTKAKDIKIMLQEKVGIDPAQLKIIFGGKLMNDTDIIVEKGIKNLMTLHSVIMLRGG